MFILHQLLLILTFFVCLSFTAIFSPDTEDYDAYGLKVAANNLMIVQAENDFSRFNIQFANYTDDVDTNNARGCYVYNNPSFYFYAVALGKSQSVPGFFFIGEWMNMTENDPMPYRTHFGFQNYTGSLDTIDCDGFIYSEGYVAESFPHQEHLVITTDPLGLVAYIFSNNFVIAYTPSTNKFVDIKSNSFFPSTSFFPYAVDYDGSHGIIAGFVEDTNNSRM
ncbi:unnamed protein product [Rotaria sp. Silwood1]|nr:unnamed protein product [Rotaria sp. Silwood1]CAF1660142.1 unnamed protein product [Rotaria sp. Silwood1]CAF4993045.1 unnamed protein product [Rotaria sp. Silwood1]